MAHDASQNNPLKESVMAVAGLVLLLVIIGGIAVSAWLRPAGEHQPTETVVAEQAEESAEAAPVEEAKEATDAQAAEKSAETADAEAPKADASEAEAKPTEAEPVAEDKADETKAAN